MTLRLEPPDSPGIDLPAAQDWGKHGHEESFHRGRIPEDLANPRRNRFFPSSQQCFEMGTVSRWCIRGGVGSAACHQHLWPGGSVLCDGWPESRCVRLQGDIRNLNNRLSVINSRAYSPAPQSARRALSLSASTSNTDSVADVASHNSQHKLQDCEGCALTGIRKSAVSYQGIPLVIPQVLRHQTLL